MRAPKDRWPGVLSGPRETVHAVGVIALHYGRLEVALRSLFAVVAEIPLEPTARILFPKITNIVRLRIMEEMLEERKLPSEIDERVKRFMKAFATCAENRNGVMHSHIAGGT